ncbi:hypothetical protein KDK_73090 [Dictyobacter kobayashii]|uniref:PPM-type phosphatase domain-containing protein n=1 Tax=Dictyobacter kobayashii TaxID=2014872 RepID=A0A402AWQ0_9CHLR|nr:hypothetical protein KDK_73090 [Dictyobacter kobayashii]
MFRHIWNDFNTRQSFEDDLREAELLAEQAVQQEDFMEDELPPTPPVRSRATAVLNRAPIAPPQAPSRPARQVERPQTRAMPVPIARQSAYTAVPQAVGDVRFPGLTYPTPVLRQTGREPSVPVNNRRTTDLQRPAQRAMPDLDRPVAQPAHTVRQQLRIVPPATLEEMPDTEEDVDIDQAFTELLERQKRERQALQFERQTDEDDLEVDLWETRPGDFDEDIDIELYDTAQGLDDTLPAPTSHKAQQHTELAAGDSFDFDQQVYPSPHEPAHETGTDAVSTEAAAPRFIVGIGLDPGLTRKDAPNEDSIFAIQGMRVTDEGSKPAGLFMVADGMGGHANGREASRTTIHTISDVIVPALLRDVSGSDARAEKTLFQDMLKDGVHRANIALYRRNREMPRMMGTTLTAALVVDRTAYIANVGDSRTYLYRPGEGLSQITHDHSVVARLVDDGVITREEIYTHPQRNQIYRCLGEHASVEIDSFAVPLQVNDVLLLCSDGLWEMVRDQALERIIASSAHNPSQLSALLIQAALNHGGADNVSVVVVGLASGEDASNWML